MKIGFMSGLYRNEKEIIENSKGLAQIAANEWAWAFLRGMEENLQGPMDIINSIFVGSFPKHYKRLICHSSKFSHAEGSNDIDIGFLNVFGLKHIIRGIRISRYAKRWGKGGDAIILYSLHMPFIYAAIKAKKRNPDLKLCCIVLDFPENMDLNKGKKIGPYRWLSAINTRYIYKNLKHLDCFVLLTEEMKKPLNIAEGRYTVVEGLVDEARFANKHANKPREKKIIFYAGTLYERYGINDLINAFMLIPDTNFELQICGSGENQGFIKDCARKDSRIKYLGVVPPEDVVALEIEADLIVNPRRNVGEFTKYSFPSKNMEALATGTPLLGFPLYGIPKEYFEHMFLFTDESVSGMANRIKEVLDFGSLALYEKGESARRFVLENKNNVKQAARVLDMLKAISAK